MHTTYLRRISRIISGLSGYAPVVVGTPAISPTVTAGASVDFAPALVVGTPPITDGFQWETGPAISGPWTAISGETGLTLLAAPSAGQYLTASQTPSNAFGTATVARAVAALIGAAATPPAVTYGATADAGQTDVPADAAAHSLSTDYKPSDMVSYGGVVYWAIKASTGVLPPSALFWRPIVATRYMDATGGNDANDGLTTGTAWQTLPQLVKYLISGTGFTPFSPGTLILFKRGEVFSGQIQANPNTSGVAGYMLGAYGAGTRPEIRWTATSTPSGTSRGPIWCNRSDFKIRNLIVDGRYAELGVKKQGVDTTGDDCAFVNSIVRNVGGDGLAAGGGSAKFRYYAKNSSVVSCGIGGHPGNGITGAPTGSIFENLTITDCGDSATLSHGIYLFTWNFVTVKRNLITGSSSFGINSGAKGESPLVEENSISGSPGGIDMGYSNTGTGQTFTGTLRVRKNLIRNTTTYGIRIAACANAEIENNLILNFSNTALVFERSPVPADAGTLNVKVRHNTMIRNTGSGGFVSASGGLVGFEFRNNLCYAPASVVFQLFQFAGNAGAAMDPAEYTITHNLVYAPSMPVGSFVRWNGTLMSLATWQGTHSKGASTVQTDPLLVSTTIGSENVNLSASSPARNAGANAGVTTDFDGTARDATPHIGAKETA